MQIRRYKKVLKSCEKCRRLNYIKYKDGKVENYCKIYTFFLNKCDRKKNE